MQTRLSSTLIQNIHLTKVAAALKRLEANDNDKQLVENAVTIYQFLMDLKSPDQYPKPQNMAQPTEDDFSFLPPKFFYGNLRKWTADHVGAAERYNLWDFFRQKPFALLQDEICPVEFKEFSQEMDKLYNHSGGSMIVMCNLLHRMGCLGWNGYVIDVINDHLQKRQEYDRLFAAHPDLWTRFPTDKKN